MEVISKPKPLLNATDRASEILFGVIMTLTFTCSIGIANAKNTEISQLVIAAISCNIAWGLVDATAHLVSTIAERSRSRTILNSIRSNMEKDRAREYIAGSLPSAVASVLKTEELDDIRNRMINLPELPPVVWVTVRDIKRSLLIFLLMFISTLPIVIPFIFIKDTQIALRVSNLVAVVIMFLCGWSVAKYVGFNKWIMSISMTLIGVLLVLITIVLGG